MNNAISISPQPPVASSMNYQLLREQGLQYIEKIASGLWTDYNVHDPGITLLELLCYAITDLGYRTGFPVADLLATRDNNRDTFASQFYSAAQILPVRPVTVNDYRKLFINIRGVKNAWLRKGSYTLLHDLKDDVLVGAPPEGHKYAPLSLNGIYDVLLELDAPSPEDDDEERAENIIAQAREVFHRNRNLCEDLGNVYIIEEQRFLVCADIEITAAANPETVMAEILFVIGQYLSPPVRQYSLQDMLSMQHADSTPYRTDEIFEGPWLENGFIPDEELEKAILRTNIYTSDIISLVMDIPGVRSVKKILLNYCDTPASKRYEWCIPVTPWRKAALCTDKNAIHLFKDVIPVSVDKVKMQQQLDARIQAEQDAAAVVKSTDWPYTFGTHHQLADYTPLLHQLPATYGVGPDGLPANASAVRKAQSNQLKGYLSFFDQVLANYLSQLANVRELFQVRFSDTELLEKPQTYFFQKIAKQTFPGVDKLLSDYDTFEQSAPGALTPHLPELVAEYDDAVERSNRFLDHLLARFSEHFSDYVMQLYSLYGQKAAGDVVTDKRIFLNEYPKISANRGGGFDYYNEDVTVWDTDNVSGMEHRIARLLGMPNFNRRVLSTIKYEIFQEKDSDGKDEYRFRLMDPVTNKILLSSSTKYYIKADCEAVFKTAMRLAADRTNYRLKTTVDGKFYFNLADETNDVVARRIEYFDTEQKMEDALAFLLQFVRKNYSDEGLFVVEHLLIRPDLVWLGEQPDELPNAQNFLPVCAEQDCADGCGEDPYSFRITVVLPAETARFRDTGFRQYIEQLIRMETPAHIQPKICWLNDRELQQFEEAFRNWLEKKHSGELNTPEGLEALQQFAAVLYRVKSIYPPGNLSDCAHPSDTPIVLGRSSLGSLDA
ncbi:hypothetical protein MKQ68_00290 [Chitinophaga horti]|uniref:Diguanylate cyclase n=1 Tax=Chitinophaga horti TaxID=2920382 RepID=A0ABY6J1U5_9BACT|nr:hypothetical protein [Chitinophaga horti]UYQ93538.1 hypothetical protein MKQ68_00290 [Chitinophaga horti]